MDSDNDSLNYSTNSGTMKRMTNMYIDQLLKMDHPGSYEAMKLATSSLYSFNQEILNMPTLTLQDSNEKPSWEMIAKSILTPFVPMNKMIILSRLQKALEEKAKENENAAKRKRRKKGGLNNSFSSNSDKEEEKSNNKATTQGFRLSAPNTLVITQNSAKKTVRSHKSQKKREHAKSFDEEDLFLNQKRKIDFKDSLLSAIKTQKKADALQIIPSRSQQQALRNGVINMPDPKKLSGKYRRRSCHCSKCGQISIIEKKFADVLPYTRIAQNLYLQKKIEARRNAKNQKPSISLEKSIYMIAQLEKLKKKTMVRRSSRQRTEIRKGLDPDIGRFNKLTKPPLTPNITSSLESPNKAGGNRNQNSKTIYISTEQQQNSPRLTIKPIDSILLKRIEKIKRVRTKRPRSAGAIDNNEDPKKNTEIIIDEIPVLQSGFSPKKAKIHKSISANYGDDLQYGGRTNTFKSQESLEKEEKRNFFRKSVDGTVETEGDEESSSSEDRQRLEEKERQERKKKEQRKQCLSQMMNLKMLTPRATLVNYVSDRLSRMNSANEIPLVDGNGNERESLYSSQQKRKPKNSYLSIGSSNNLNDHQLHDPESMYLNIPGGSSSHLDLDKKNSVYLYTNNICLSKPEPAKPKSFTLGARPKLSGKLSITLDKQDKQEPVAIMVPEKQIEWERTTTPYSSEFKTNPRSSKVALSYKNKSLNTQDFMKINNNQVKDSINKTKKEALPNLSLKRSVLEIKNARSLGSINVFSPVSLLGHKLESKLESKFRTEAKTEESGIESKDLGPRDFMSATKTLFSLKEADSSGSARKITKGKKKKPKRKIPSQIDFTIQNYMNKDIAKMVRTPKTPIFKTADKFLSCRPATSGLN